MKKTLKIKLILIIAILIVVMAGISAANYIFFLQKAHSTFENYYAFRGCVQLISTTTDSGTCRIGSGEIIKIVKYQDKWYLDGDLPYPGLNFL